uniref:Uncharacterized protein n=2 Tax=Physcomitrium patens TaxID=3218 RepID=A0A2K1KNL7_PHYPA|nr:uncharacterized protein LOC112280975 [Physcomitrium patens]PNR55375.1 hypothetical protein PHYPA_006272 [Physcomitrium patens]|eukprot:XP_024372753.1 uncharacterized protein LOC112280975 [Physcomitrella patens]
MPVRRLVGEQNHCSNLELLCLLAHLSHRLALASALPTSCPYLKLSSFLSPVQTMASTSVLRSVVVIFAVASSLVAMANAQAASPSPAPDSAGNLSIVPSIVAPVMGMVITFFASRMLW